MGGDNYFTCLPNPNALMKIKSENLRFEMQLIMADGGASGMDEALYIIWWRNKLLCPQV